MIHCLLLGNNPIRCSKGLSQYSLGSLLNVTVDHQWSLLLGGIGESSRVPTRETKEKDKLLNRLDLERQQLSQKL